MHRYKHCNDCMYITFTDTLPGEVIGRIVASDVDQGQTLTFNFRDRPTDYPIRIQRITGEIVLLRAIRYDDTKTLDFSVTVSLIRQVMVVQVDPVLSVPFKFKVKGKIIINIYKIYENYLIQYISS